MGREEWRKGLQRKDDELPVYVYEEDVWGF